MTKTLEEDLGAAFAARVACLPHDAAAQVRAVDYRPRQHPRALPVGLGAGAAAGAATAGTVLALVLGGATPAYAGWSADPSSSGPSSAAPPDCLTSLSGTTGSADTGTWPTLLTDVRGPFTITLLQSGTSYATCFTGPSFTEVNRIDAPSSGSSAGTQTGLLNVSQGTNAAASASEGGVGSLVRIETTSSGDLTQVLQNHLTTAADGPYTFIDGRVANGVSGVTLVLNGGTDVVSTVADGWFVAWWPGDTADATSAQVTKSSGTTSETFVPIGALGMKAAPGMSTPAGTLPTNPGTCTTTSSSNSSGPSTTCKSTTTRGGPGTNASGKSADSGATGSTGVTGSSGSGPTTKSNP